MYEGWWFSVEDPTQLHDDPVVEVAAVSLPEFWAAADALLALAGAPDRPGFAYRVQLLGAVKEDRGYARGRERKVLYSVPCPRLLREFAIAAAKWALKELGALGLAADPRSLAALKAVAAYIDVNASPRVGWPELEAAWLEAGPERWPEPPTGPAFEAAAAAAAAAHPGCRDTAAWGLNPEATDEPLTDEDIYRQAARLAAEGAVLHAGHVTRVSEGFFSQRLDVALRRAAGRHGGARFTFRDQFPPKPGQLFCWKQQPPEGPEKFEHDPSEFESWWVITRVEADPTEANTWHVRARPASQRDIDNKPVDHQHELEFWAGASAQQARNAN